MEAFAFWPDADPQFPLTSYTGAIEVLPNDSAAAAQTAP